MNSKRLVVLALLAGLFMLSSTAFAHHSTAEFDLSQVTVVNGTVTQFEWTDPHAYIHVVSKVDKGNVEWFACDHNNYTYHSPR